MTVLNGAEIRAAIETGQLVFDPPIEDGQIGVSSVDLRLGHSFTSFQKPPLDSMLHVVDLAKIAGTDDVEDIAKAYGVTKVLDPGEPFTLNPERFVLGYTKEHIKLPADMAARVEGRSSFARLGLTVHQTAPTVNAGWGGYLRLEIRNNGLLPCLLYGDLMFCQLIIERVGPSPPPD